ncbi:MAG: c-type cytochrome biogenesis protein CcmI [Acidimicrobiia bacterium]
MAVDVTAGGGFDPDELARREEQRQFLRRSLADLDRELAAGDLDGADHAALAEDYRRRLADVDAEVARGRLALPAARRRPARAVAAVVLVGVVALGAGLAVAAGAGGRRPGDTITGSVPQTTLGRLTEAARLANEGKVTAALEVFDQILEDDPANVEALGERGLLLVSSGFAAESQALVDRGLASIEEAIRVRPADPRARFYLGLTLRLLEQPDAAAEAFATALANDPAPTLRRQIEAAQEDLAAETSGSTTTTTR